MVPIVIVYPISRHPLLLNDNDLADCAESSATTPPVPLNTASPPATHAPSTTPSNQLIPEPQVPVPPSPAPVPATFPEEFPSASQKSAAWLRAGRSSNPAVAPNATTTAPHRR